LVKIIVFVLTKNDLTVKPDKVFHLGGKSLAICNGFYENGFGSEFSKS